MRRTVEIDVDHSVGGAHDPSVPDETPDGRLRDVPPAPPNGTPSTIASPPLLRDHPQLHPHHNHQDRPPRGRRFGSCQNAKPSTTTSSSISDAAVLKSSGNVNPNDRGRLLLDFPPPTPDLSAPTAPSLPAGRVGGGEAPSIRWAVVPVLAEVEAKRWSRQAPLAFLWQLAGKGAAVGSDLEGVGGGHSKKIRRSPNRHPPVQKAQRRRRLPYRSGPRQPTATIRTAGNAGEPRERPAARLAR